MLATNPKTGGTIRLMKSDASVWKNKKTLVWMKGPPTSIKDPMRWKRWDIAIEGVDPKLLAWNPQLVIIREDSPEVRKWLSQKDAKEVRFILISSKIVESIGSNTFRNIGLGNVLCLEEFTEMYPYLGDDWDGSMEDALVNAAIVFRYQRLVGVSIAKPSVAERMSNLFIKPVTLEICENSAAPEPLVLIQQYYKPKEAVRAAEIDKCLKKNLENPLIDKVYLLSESANYKLPKSDKLVLIVKKERITYANCIELIQKQIGKGHLVAFANADIYLDLSWVNLWTTDIHDTVLALLRWEEEGANGQPELYGPRSDSQDTWVIHSDSVLERSWPAQLAPFQIPFGIAGCDNAILVEFLRQKFKIVNPAMSLRTIHVHKSQVRTYDPQDIVDRPVYMHVEPTGIHELNPLTSWSSWTKGSVEHLPLDRPLKATTSKNLAMFCSQMNRDPSFLWSADGLNTYVAPVKQDHEIFLEDGAFVSPGGLVYKHSDLCVGSSDVQKGLWSDNKISHLMPAQHTPAMMCFPLEYDWLLEPSLYTLYYLARVVKQHQVTPEASFWCSKTADLLPAFKLFNWKSPRGHLVQYNDQMQVFADKVVGRTAHSVRIMPADVDALRQNMFSQWVSEPTLDKPVAVLVSDEVHIKDALLNDLEAYLTEQGYIVRIIFAAAEASLWVGGLLGASRVILSSSVKQIKGSSWAWMWLAPKGCKILELQEEREPSDSLVHLCAAAGLDWTLLQYPRSTPDGFKKIVLKEVAKWFITNEQTKSLPLLLMPPKTMKFGFFGHKGDSFRELAEMWAEKGYVEIKEDPILTQCWLGAVGKTLLYDRPTWQWLEKSAESEQTFKTCLAGNPDAKEKGAQPWIFWPRNPKLVEKLALTSEKSYNDRSQRMVFYGRVENDAQGAHRQDAGWKALCSDFSMPVGAKEAYKFSPEEYLVALQNAKYGLCLRGYGPKCNREIELLAMGTVPVVTPGVDITGYSEPLVDGIHVICVSDLADAKAKLAAMTESQWETMSKAGKLWWKRNSSAEGSWLRTQPFA
jgi:hypothetical protein